MGRVVIPKEIRRTLRIREGDPLEIFTDREGEVIFKKYSPMGELSDFANAYAETLHKTCSIAVVITDKDGVIATAGVPKRDFAERKLNPMFDALMEARSFYEAQVDTDLCVVEGAGEVRCAAPIIADGDVVGCVCSVSPQSGASLPDVETEHKLIQTAAVFLGHQF